MLTTQQLLSKIESRIAILVKNMCEEDCRGVCPPYGNRKYSSKTEILSLTGSYVFLSTYEEYDYSTQEINNVIFKTINILQNGL